MNIDVITTLGAPTGSVATTAGVVMAFEVPRGVAADRTRKPVQSKSSRICERRVRRCSWKLYS